MNKPQLQLQPKFLFAAGVGLCGGLMLSPLFRDDSPIVLRQHPTIVAAMYSNHQLLFRASASNNSMFYLAPATNGTFLKLDFIWNASSPSNAIDKIHHNQY